MKSMMLLGLVLVVAGIVLFVLQASGVFVERAGVEVAGVELAVESQRSLPWLPWAAGGAVGVGALLMLLSRR